MHFLLPTNEPKNTSLQKTEINLESLTHIILKTKEQVQSIFRIDQANFQDIVLALKQFFSQWAGFSLQKF